MDRSGSTLNTTSEQANTMWATAVSTENPQRYRSARTSNLETMFCLPENFMLRSSFTAACGVFDLDRGPANPEGAEPELHALISDTMREHYKSLLC